MKLINKPVVLLVFSLVLLLSIGSVCASDDIGVSDIDNSDLGVSSLSEVPVEDNNVNNLGANPGSFSDLQTLIDDTSSGATLDLTDDYSFNKNTDNNKGISITKDITINGNGHTLNGNFLSRIFNISQSNVIFKDLNFINGYANTSRDDSYGGAIYAKDSNVSVINCNFDNNTVYAGNGFGGAIYCPDGYVNAINSNFVNNSASWSMGGAIYSKSISLVNCNLTDNYAMWGGAIYSKTYVNVTNSNFKDNFVYANDGGSIYSNGDVNVLNSSFINSVASCRGGVIFINDKGNANLTNCDFINNTAGDGDGGVVYTPEGNIAAINCNFVDNYVYYGGGILATELGNVNVTNCNFTNSFAEGEGEDGGAVFTHEGNITAINSNFINNIIERGNGGAIATNNGTVIVMNCSFVNNSADYDGGAIYCVYGDLTVGNCSFVNNSALEDDGGAIYFYEDYDGDSKFSVINCSFVNNSALESDGGAIYVEEGNLTIEDSSFVNNFAGDCCGGGAIYFDDGDLIIKNTNFVDNHVEASYFYVYGGAVYAYGGSYGNVTIVGSNFTNNYIKTDYYAYGGAVYVYDGDILTIDNCNFNNNYINSSHNEDSSYGGAVYAYSDGYGNVTIVGSNFTNNYIKTDYYAYGGAVYVYDGDILTIDNCNFNNNYINSSHNDYGSCGAAIYADESINVSNSNFINNSITAKYGEGAAIYADEGINVTNSTFINNTITADIGEGAAIYAADDSIIKDSYFINNHINALSDDESCGGAVYAVYAVDISNSTFVNNTIIGTDESCGGAIYSYDELKVEYCIFDANNATTGKDIYWKSYDDCSYSLDNNYWSMNFTTKEEFINADLVSIYDENGDTYSVAPDNWVLMSIYAPDELKVGVSAPIVVKLDKLTDGSSISDFTGSLPDYYTSAYAFTKSENDSYNHVWDGENPDVGSFVGNLWIRDGVGSFNFTAPVSGEYVFRTHSPFTTWEEAVTTTATAPFYNMSISESTLNKTVYVGNQTEFLIVVRNTGDSNLTGVYVVEKSSDDMVYDSWRPVSGNWVYSFVDGVHRWTLDGSLAPNETASFILVFNTTSVGNKTNIVLGGSNELDNLSAENVTEVINKTKPNPDPNPDPTPTPEPNPVPDNGGSDSVVNKMVSTGNPLALIIISLFTIFVGGLKRKI